MTLLETAPMEVFYMGGKDFKSVKKMLRKAFRDLPRGELDFDIGTDIRMNTVEPKVRLFTEELAVTQGKLSMGFRLGEIMDDPDYAALYVLNALYGGSVTSKLFMNVREKLSLCYYASSMCDVNKGVMFVYSGIEFDKYDAAYNEILAQLDAVKNGDFTEEELDSARQAVAAELRTYMDSERDLEHYWLSRNLRGEECDPMEMSAMVEAVTREDILNAAQGIVLDAVYFLKGSEEELEEEEE
jgi:predicted Zn-dependent peptidase